MKELIENITNIYGKQGKEWIANLPTVVNELSTHWVAEKLGWQFIDADFSLTPSIGRRVDEIIGKQAENAFQDCLAEILAYQITKENIVVTTDDSIVCHENCRKLLSREFTVNLKVSTRVQLERISHNRPLLPVADYKNFLDKLHQERDALYEQSSSFSLNSDDNDLEGHVLSVVKEIRG